MKPQPAIDPNAAGEEVKRLLAEDGIASAAFKDMRSAKAARKEQLKTALTVVWEAFESGATVNGFATREEWTAKYAGCTMRHAQHIIYGRTRSEANNGSRAFALDKLDGKVVSLRGVKFTLTILPDRRLPEAGEKIDLDHFCGVTIHKNGRVEYTPHDLDVRLTPVDMPTPKPAPKKKERLIHVPDLRMVTKAKAAHQSLCEVNLLNRRNKPLRKGEEPNCKKCLEIAKTVDNKVAVPAPVAPKVKKLTAAETKEALWRFESGYKERHADDHSVAWMEQYEKNFFLAVSGHPEWLAKTVNTKRREIVKELFARRTSAKQLQKQIRIKLTEAQMREVKLTDADAQTAVVPMDKLLVFSAESYQEDAKSLVLELEKRVESLHAEAGKQKETLKDYKDKSPENVAAFEEQARLQGSIKACDGAIRAIVFGDMTDDPARNIREWFEEHKDERLGLSDDQPALTLVIADECPTEYEK